MVAGYGKEMVIDFSESLLSDFLTAVQHFQVMPLGIFIVFRSKTLKIDRG
jgi:hypothetical protein